MPNWESLSTREIAEFVARVGKDNLSEGERSALYVELRARIGELRARTKADYRDLPW